MKVFLSIGDLSAANYVYEIFKEVKGFSFVGITDDRLESIGVRSIGRMSDLSVVGVWEVMPKILGIRRIFKKALEELSSCDALLACDAPGFNLRLIREAKRLGVKRVVYFISPQVWAWKPGRAKVISEHCDHLVVILPFEVDVYRPLENEKFRVHYVGHPLVDMVRPGVEESRFRETLKLKNRFINLMPGSRQGEVRKHAKELVKVVKNFAGMDFVVPTFDEYRGFLEETFRLERVRVITPENVPLPAYSSMFYSEISLIASGTASLEAALALNPHVVFYRINPITYLIGKLLVKVPYVSLPNIILGRKVVPEIINGKPDELVREADRLLRSGRARTQQREHFARLRSVLGEGGVVERLRSLLPELLT